MIVHDQIHNLSPLVSEPKGILAFV
jgi:hypothetical protein